MRKYGAASVPVHLSLAVEAFRHGYGPSDDLLVWAASDAGMRASLVARRAGRH